MEHSISEKSVYDLVLKIVNSEFNDELVEFELAGEDLIGQKLSDPDNEKPGLDDEQYEFGASITDVLKFIVLIGGTVEAIKIIVDLLKSKKDDDKEKKLRLVSKMWAAALVNEGLNPEKAEEIATSFADDFYVGLVEK